VICFAAHIATLALIEHVLIHVLIHFLIHGAPRAEAKIFESIAAAR
jgi:hypothetical protein